MYFISLIKPSLAGVKYSNGYIHTGKKVNLNLTYKSNMLWKISVDFWSGHHTHLQLMIGGCRMGRDIICAHALKSLHILIFSFSTFRGQ